MSNVTEEKVKWRPSLSLLAIISFVASFLVARTFTILNPHTTLRIAGYHIHHYWYGIALLAVGGWLGISYKSERMDRLAAILYGAGGGIFGDEVGLQLTGYNNYWTGITYTFIIVFLMIVLLLALLFRYSRAIADEFAGLTRSRAGLYFGILLGVVSIAVLLRRINMTVITVSAALTIISIAIIISYFIHILRKRGQAEHVPNIPNETSERYTRKLPKLRFKRPDCLIL
ncbi:MAG TPA: hypothetical protein VEH86_03635 [Candidatus Acidoferrum sp.]|nr:hypothetical protein [Candidatus Acidoferrum sp.]